LLVDSSVWIDVLRGKHHERFRTFAATNEIVTCLPVLQEVLQGFDSDPAFRVAQAAFVDVRVLEPTLTREIYDEAIALYRAARRRGFTIRSSVDCLIAICAIRNNETVLHNDRDFDSLATVSDLRATRFVSSP
jgi:predicted nucleic acid-binding protein